jgi:hypothetical protein
LVSHAVDPDRAKGTLLEAHTYLQDIDKAFTLAS